MKVDHMKGTKTPNFMAVLYSIWKCTYYSIFRSNKKHLFEVEVDFPVDIFTNPQDPEDWYKIIGYKSGIDTKTNNEDIVVYRTVDQNTLEVANYVRRHKKISTPKLDITYVNLEDVRKLVTYFEREVISEEDYEEDFEIKMNISVSFVDSKSNNVYHIINDGDGWFIRIRKKVKRWHLLPVWPHAGGDKENINGEFYYYLKTKKSFKKENNSKLILEEYLKTII